MVDQSIQPTPVPTQLSIGTAEAGDGREWVMLHFTTASGVGVYFLDRDTALNAAAEIRKHAKEGPKLVTPPSGLVLPA